MSLELYSGGAIGADHQWEKSCSIYKVKISNFYICSFSEHGVKTNGFGKVLRFEDSQLLKFEDEILEVSEILKRNFKDKDEYSKNLIRRNFYQVLSSEEVFAVSNIDKTGKFVKGGTGYTVEFAKMLGLKIYVYNDQNWHVFDGDKFQILEERPKITKNSTLIGTRELTNIGISEINAVCLNSFTS